jgi:hypothetical protein
MPPLLDLAAQAAVVGYLVEVFKDVFQRAPTNVTRVFMYAVSFVIVALVTWKPGLQFNEYVLTVLIQGGGVATAAWGVHGAVKAAVPTLPAIAVAEAKVKAAPAVRSRAELEAEGRAKEEAAQLEAEAARVTAIVKQVLAEKPATPVDPPPAIAGPGVTRVPRERDLTGGTP